MDEAKFEYVGFWLRVVASIIDTILLAIVVSCVGFVVLGSMDPDVSATSLVINNFLPAVIVIVLWIRFAGTPGKMVISARIVDADTGEPLSAGRATIRYIGYYVSAFALFAGFFWIAFDRRKQGWHDKFANSVVVRPVVGNQVSFVPPNKNSEPGRQ